MKNYTKSCSTNQQSGSNLTIILVDDDPNTCQSFEENSKAICGIDIVSITNNIERAIEDIYLFQPDVIILELELHNGVGNGFELLEILKENPPVRTPFILINTKNASSLIYNYARVLGADIIQFKGQRNYSESYILHLLQIIKSANLDNPKILKASDNYTLNAKSPIYGSQYIRDNIRHELDNIEMNPKLKGYQYLIDGIELYINSIHKNICARIAENYQVSTSSVERAMETAIKNTWTNTKPTILENQYTSKLHYKKDCPTIKEFITFYANKLKHC